MFIDCAFMKSMYLWIAQGLQSGKQMYDLGKIHCVASLQLKWCKLVLSICAKERPRSAEVVSANPYSSR